MNKIRPILGALIFLLLLALGGWYLFLRSQTQSIEVVGEGRGFNAGGTPTFFGSTGSTFENIAGGLGGAERSTSTPPQLWHVHTAPVAGVTFVGTTTIIRFVERATGHVFEADVVTGDVRRITNSLIPRVYEVVFSGKDSIAMRVLDERGEVTAHVVTLSGSTTDGVYAVAERDLGSSILSLTPANKDTLLTLVEEAAGATLVRSSWSGSNPQKVFSSALRGWRIFASPSDTMTIVQKAGSGIPGFAYKIEENGDFTPLVRNIPGLTILPRPTGDALLVGSDNGALNISIRPTENASFVTVPIRTVADKCVWTPGEDLVVYCAVPGTISSSRFLDDWYQGVLHTDDSWWKVEASAGTAELVFSPQDALGVALDVENPVMDDSGTYVAFMNARDKSLWVLKILD